jgi:hypothetical protein
MADPTAPPNESVVGATSRLGQALISALPPAFIMLVLINAAFLGVVMWFMDNQIDQRTKLVSNFVDRCMADIAKIENLGAMQARQDALEHDIRAVEVELREQRKK